MNRVMVSFGHDTSFSYGIVEDGRVVAVLYFDNDAHDSWGDHDDIYDVFWWYVVAVDQPYNHHGLDTPPLLGDMTPEQREANAEVALDAAVRWLEARS